jgi:hypothetical protein
MKTRTEAAVIGIGIEGDQWNSTVEYALIDYEIEGAVTFSGWPAEILARNTC